MTIVGRAKDLVIAGGYNIYPKEVELLLDAEPGVAESAVFGAPHPDLGEAVVAVVMPKPGAALDEARCLPAFATVSPASSSRAASSWSTNCRSNTMGKVQKNVLRERYKGVFMT